MTGRRSLHLGALAALSIGVAAMAPATRAQDSEPDPGGGAAITGQVLSLLELSLQSGGPNAVIAQVTASIPRAQLLAGSPAAAPGSALRIGAGAGAPRRIRPGTRLLLTRWNHAVTRSRVVLRARSTPASARGGSVLEITAAPQTP